jgi:hypothetical protein
MQRYRMRKGMFCDMEDLKIQGKALNPFCRR